MPIRSPIRTGGGRVAELKARPYRRLSRAGTPRSQDPELCGRRGGMESLVSRILFSRRSFLWEPCCHDPRAIYPKAVRVFRLELGRAAHEPPSYSILLRMGFTVPRSSPTERCALTAPFHPCPRPKSPAVCSLLHFPSRRRASPLTSMLPVGVRTFLPRPLCGRERPHPTLHAEVILSRPTPPGTSIAPPSPGTDA